MAIERIGNQSADFWTYDADTGLMDLSRRTDQDTKGTLTLQTRTYPIRYDPAKSALVIIDMQNYFLEPGLRGASAHKEPPSKGLLAAKALKEIGIPAARKHGIPVVWVNWGLTDEEVATMPPSMMKAFGVYDIVENQANGNSALPKKTKSRSVYKGLGAELGTIELADGTKVDGGRTLMRDTWNAALYPSLDEEYKKGASAVPPDAWVHKNRMSALWGTGTDLDKFLQKEGIKTLFFAGVNTDQCVGGTLTDAFSKGYDCVLLTDGAATSSPACAQEAFEYNAAYTWGFLASCQDISDSVAE